MQKISIKWINNIENRNKLYIKYKQKVNKENRNNFQIIKKRFKKKRNK